MGGKFMGKNCLIANDYKNKQVVFTEEQRLLKAEKHPELREQDFINGRVKEAIQYPDFVYQDLANCKERIAAYKLEYAVNGRSRYTKVIISIKNIPYFVITAYRPDYVKERGKTKLLYGKDN
jgi:ribosome biogenesis protein Nip4